MAEDEYRDAMRRAADHRRQAGELFAQHRRDGDETVLARAKEENARAVAWEEKAAAAKGRGSKSRGSKDQGFKRNGEADPFTERRTWYKEGSVSPEKLQQFQEAAQDGSLMGQLVNYAARSVVDREHRTFDGAKLAGKAVAAPVKGAVKGGRAILDTARRHKSHTPSLNATQKSPERGGNAPAQNKKTQTADRGKTRVKTRAKTRHKGRER